MESPRSDFEIFPFTTAELAATAVYLEQIPPRVPDNPCNTMDIMLGFCRWNAVSFFQLLR